MQSIKISSLVSRIIMLPFMCNRRHQMSINIEIENYILIISDDLQS